MPAKKKKDEKLVNHRYLCKTTCTLAGGFYCKRGQMYVTTPARMGTTVKFFDDLGEYTPPAAGPDDAFKIPESEEEAIILARTKASEEIAEATAKAKEEADRIIAEAKLEAERIKAEAAGDTKTPDEFGD